MSKDPQIELVLLVLRMIEAQIRLIDTEAKLVEARLRLFNLL